MYRGVLFLRWNKKKLEIYQYLIGSHPYGAGKHFSASQIAGFLGVSRSYVHRIKRQLNKEGYIFPLNRKTTPKIYNSTKKQPPKDLFTKPKKTSRGSSPVGVNNFTGVSRGGSLTTSKSRWSCPIEKPPRNLKGWTVKTLKNGVKHYYKKILFDKPIDAPVLFQIVGKNKFTMTLTFPGFTFDSIGDFRSSRELVKDYAKMAFRYVSQLFKIPMRVKHTRYSSGDFECPLRDVDIKRFIDTATVTINFKNGLSHVGKLDFDGSGRVDKIESDIPDWIADYSEIPNFSRRLQTLEKSFEGVFDRYFSEINKRIEEIVTEKFNEMFSYDSDFKKDIEGYK
ncbi:MAG: helix-turn-helix domain-containing protein [Candidatus Thermoplasmatota archaeon]